MTEQLEMCSLSCRPGWLTCQGEAGACHITALGVVLPVLQLILRSDPLSVFSSWSLRCPLQKWQTPWIDSQNEAVLKQIPVISDTQLQDCATD